MISRQIEAQSASIKLLLQAIAFFDKPVSYEALRLLADDEDISRLVEHNLATIERDLRGSVYYNLHNYFSKQTLATLPKFEDSFDIKSYADNLFNIGYKQYTHHFLTNAINLYECSEKIYEYLDLPNDVADSYVGKGVSLRQLGKLNEAIAEYDKAILILKGLVESGRLELSNDLAMAYMNKGVSLDSLGKLNEAIEHYGDAINLWEETLQHGEIQNLPNIAKALGIRLGKHRKAGNNDSAEKDMRRLHELLAFTKQHKEIEHLGESIQKQIDKWG